jgi:hypothetical protein
MHAQGRASSRICNLYGCNVVCATALHVSWRPRFHWHPVSSCFLGHPSCHLISPDTQAANMTNQAGFCLECRRSNCRLLWLLSRAAEASGTTTCGNMGPPEPPIRWSTGCSTKVAASQAWGSWPGASSVATAWQPHRRVPSSGADSHPG